MLDVFSRHIIYYVHADKKKIDICHSDRFFLCYLLKRSLIILIVKLNQVHGPNVRRPCQTTLLHLAVRHRANIRRDFMEPE